MIPSPLLFLSLAVTVSSNYRPEAAAPIAGISYREVSKPSREWSYTHHPSIYAFEDRLYVQYSEGHRDEDSPGQRVMVTSSADGANWDPPAPIAVPTGNGVLTAAGFDSDTADFSDQQRLIAYFCRYNADRSKPQLFAATSLEGDRWSPPVELGLPLCPNHGPIVLPDGSRIIPANFSFAISPKPLGPFTIVGPSTPKLGRVPDSPATYTGVSQRMRWGAALCEGSPIIDPNGTIRMMLRSSGKKWGWLYETDSNDAGRTWTPPRPTHFPDNDAKFHFGRLPDGRFFYVGNPDRTKHFARNPLILSLSDDGLNFSRHFIVGDAPYKIEFPGHAKSGAYGYPDATVFGGALWIVYSRGKERIEVARVPLAALDDPA